MYQSRRSKKAVAPVLATLLMIAVAVAMSVIIFMWSQGFLSQTSGATGSQQGSQNQAAQSSVAIETVTATASGTITDSSIPHGNITIFVRNVGAVAVNVASISITGISSNTGFNKTLAVTLLVTGGKVNATSIPAQLSGCRLANCTNPQRIKFLGDRTTSTCGAAASIGSSERCLVIGSSGSSLAIAKGGSYTFTFTLPTIAAGGSNPGKGFVVNSGDTLSIKVTTDVGTFAQTSLTVP